MRFLLLVVMVLVLAARVLSSGSAASVAQEHAPKVSEMAAERARVSGEIARFRK